MMSSPNTQNQEIDDIIEILSMDDNNDSVPELSSDSSDMLTTSDDEITEHETSNEDSDGIDSAATIEPIPLHVDADLPSESKVEEKQEEEKA